MHKKTTKELENLTIKKKDKWLETSQMSNENQAVVT